ncbi:endopolygalacturonase 2 precursor [Rhodocollybia butyracea]|uniref:endo-polygalacturonase n=1 Tax=Rhodocollybia butyracea TaxID=206335 RepID=A0A9P5P743_9AGAR|nr:endopolygalacturonase 2 precursor [Rhodocollybia butyracea]
MSLLALTTLACVLSGALASPTQASTAKRATCTVDSVATASDLTDCTSVVITAFSVPSGNTLEIKAASGASVTMSGSVTFDQTTTEGPLFTLDTDDVSFNGNGFSFKGNGPLYWDGQGTDGGSFKPHPFVKFQGSGTFTNFIIKDSPAQAISVGTTATSSFTDVLVDNSDGNALGSDGDPIGANTDGFDVSASDVTISGSTVLNQDDCIAINSGSNILFENNICTGGHGMSIGSIATGKSVSGVTFSGNTVTESMYGMRIKVDSDATDASSYSEDFGTPGTGSTVSGITFSGATTKVTTTGKFPVVGVDCGKCTGTWDWGSLDATGGEAADLVLTGGVQISGGTF